MKILFLSQYFPPEMGAPAARVSEMAKAWAELGHEVTVLTALPNHPTGVVPPEYRRRPFFRESRHGHSVVRVWLYVAANRGAVKRSASFVSFLISSTLMGAVLTARPDVIIATSPQLLVGAAGLALSRLKRVPFVLEVRDLWPKAAVELKVMSDGVLLRGLELLERNLYQAAARVAVVSEEFIPHIESAGVARDRILFVPNGVDLAGELAKPADLPEGVPAFPGAFTVSYVGTHGMAHGLSNIVRVAERFRSDPSVRFLFVGEGAEKDKVKKLAADLRLTNCIFLDVVPRPVVAAIYQASDVCLVPLIDRPAFREVLPSKIFEIMAMGRPVLLSVGGRAERLVTEAGGGISVPPEDEEAIAAAIQRLRDDPALGKQLGERGRAYVRKHFDRRVIAEKYVESLREIVATTHGR
jgi:colanic acid biosynthesis glycosyl transferase WcaI